MSKEEYCHLIWHHICYNWFIASFCQTPTMSLVKRLGVDFVFLQNTTYPRQLVQHILETIPTPPKKGTSRQPRKLILGMQPYFGPTRWNMEEDLNIFENGTGPQFFSIGWRPQCCSRQPRKLIFGMQPYFNPTRWNMEGDLIFFSKWKTA